ncbi:MAG: tetratricopeptide repeat protein, partial [bacterium]
LFFYRLIKVPLFTITDQQIIYVPLNKPWKKETVKLNHIKGFTRELFKNSFLSNGNFELIQLIIKSEYQQKYNQALRFNLKSINKKENLLGSLKDFFPDLTAMRNKGLLAGITIRKELHFKKIFLDPQGIKLKNKEIIPWENIKNIKVSNFSTFYYKAIKIKYQKNNKIQTIKVSPCYDKEYLSFLKYLLKYSSKAEVDPFVYNIFKVKPAEVNYERRIWLLNICLVILLYSLISLDILDRYILERKYFLITVPAIIFYLLYTFSFFIYRTSKMLYGEFKGIYKYYQKTLLSFLFIFLSLIILMVFTPGTADFLRGDLYLSLDQETRASRHYQNVLNIYPKNVEVLYTNASSYFHLGDYQQSYQLMTEAYALFTGRWNPNALRLLPESLVNMERYDEALEWCEKIIADHPEDNPIREVMETLKNNL